MNMRSIISNISVMGLGLGFAVGGGCLEQRAADHCANKDGDADCARRYPDGERPYCVIGTCETENLDGCYAMRPGDDACYSPCGDGKSLEEDPDCEGIADDTSTSVSSSEVTTQPSTSEPTGDVTTASTSVTQTGSETGTDASSGTSLSTSSGCAADAECTDAAAPICYEMECVPCTDAALPDAACAERDAALPACREDGECVACTATNASACEGTTPLCNAETSACEGCDFHEQCAGTACDIATGACFEDGCVVEVDGDGAADYTNIQDAIADGCVVVVHELDGGLSYQEALTIDGDTVALLAAPGETPIVQGTGGNPSLSLTGSATAYVQELDIRGNQMAEGITASGSSLYLDRTSVVGNTGGGIVLTTADGHLRNCFVGGDVNDVAALDVIGSSVEVLYSTLGAGFGTAAALRCNVAAVVEVRNSLLVARSSDPEVDCTTDSLDASATEADLGSMNTNWFAGFGTGDFHLTGLAPGAVLTAAQWQPGDPPTDIDGDLRPTEDGTADVAGADLP